MCCCYCRCLTGLTIIKPPCHQPDELIEGDAAIAILVDLSYQLLQLSLWRRPAESSHDLAELHGSDASPSIPGHRVDCSAVPRGRATDWPVKKREDFPELQHFVIRKSINRLQWLCNWSYNPVFPVKPCGQITIVIIITVSTHHPHPHLLKQCLPNWLSSIWSCLTILLNITWIISSPLSELLFISNIATL